MSFITLAGYLVTAVCIVLVFWLLGVPLRWLLELIADEPIPVPTPLVGIGVSTIVGWYWYGPFGGLVVGIRVACVVAAALAIALVVHAWRCNRINVEVRRERLGPPLTIGFFTVVLFVVSCAGILSLGYMTVGATADNADVAQYAIVGQHLRDDTIDDSGGIVGFDLGERTQASFDFGAIAMVAAASSLGPFGDVWRYLLPLVGVATGLVALSIYCLLELVAPHRRRLIAAVSIASMCPFLVAVLWSHYFLNQLVAIAMVVTVAQLLTRATTAPSRRVMRVFTVAAVPLVCHLYASYPHMLVGIPMLLLPLQLAAGPGAGPRARKLVMAGVGSLIGAGLVLPRAFFRLPDAVLDISDVDAGFPVPGFLPTEIMGFVSTLHPAHETIDWLPSVELLLVLTAAIVFVVRNDATRSAGAFAGMTIAIILATYALVYLSGEERSYRQFKWISFFAPVMVACVLLVLALAGERLLTRFVARPGLVVGGGIIAFCVITVWNSETTTFVRSRSLPETILRSNDLRFANSPAIARIDAVNIDLPPFQRTMWAAYFLRDRQVSLMHETYYPIAPPTSEWTLQLATARVAPDVLEVREVNDTYVLVRR